jgi:hypothetical protein
MTWGVATAATYRGLYVFKSSKRDHNKQIMSLLTPGSTFDLDSFNWPSACRGISYLRMVPMMKLFILDFSPLFWHFLHLRPKYFPQHSVLKLPLSLNSTIFWNVTPCIMVNMYWHFRGTYCPYLQRRTGSQAKEQLLITFILQLWRNFDNFHTVSHPRS